MNTSGDEWVSVVRYDNVAGAPRPKSALRG